MGIHASEGNFVFSSGNGGHTGVTVIVDGRYRNLVIGTRAITDQLAEVRMETAPHNVSIIQAYAPTSATPDEKINKFYCILEETLASFPRSDVVLVLGISMPKLSEQESAAVLQKRQ